MAQFFNVILYAIWKTITTKQGEEFGGFASLLIVLDLSIWFELDWFVTQCELVVCHAV